MTISTGPHTRPLEESAILDVDCVLPEYPIRVLVLGNVAGHGWLWVGFAA